MDKPRVKPLEWRVDDSQNEYAQAQYSVDRYCIEHRLHANDAFDLWIGPDATTATRFPTIEAAKAAAQADYEARILAAIEPAPVSVREAARVLYDMPETDRMKAWRATRDAPPEFAKWFCVALRAITEAED